MLSHVFQGTTIPVLQEVVYFAQARHEVLAGNVANIDTPGYRTADLSPDLFQMRLRDAIEGRDAGRQGVSSGVRDAGQSDSLRQVRESMSTLLRHDESDVGLEQQVIALADNQFLHNMAVTLMNSQFRLLEAAVSERI